MSARDEILANVRARRIRSANRPAQYALPPLPKEARLQFIERARASGAEVRELAGESELPVAIAAALRERNLPAIVHLPPAVIWDLPWETAPGVTLTREPPTGDDAALSAVPFAIAETGTLAFLSDPTRPASWHFRPGLEIAVVRAGAIQPYLESVLAKVKSGTAFPRTINLVTGPSRTGDIEQTLELGAHGPKALVIFVVDGG